MYGGKGYDLLYPKFCCDDPRLQCGFLFETSSPLVKPSLATARTKLRKKEKAKSHIKPKTLPHKKCKR
jgi:hypothetical protein